MALLWQVKIFTFRGGHRRSKAPSVKRMSFDRAFCESLLSSRRRGPGCKLFVTHSIPHPSHHRSYLPVYLMMSVPIPLYIFAGPICMFFGRSSPVLTQFSLRVLCCQGVAPHCPALILIDVSKTCMFRLLGAMFVRLQRWASPLCFLRSCNRPQYPIIVNGFLPFVEDNKFVPLAYCFHEWHGSPLFPDSSCFFWSPRKCLGVFIWGLNQWEGLSAGPMLCSSV